MKYKKITKYLLSPKALFYRLIILFPKMIKSDELYLKLKYYVNFRRNLNLDNPKTFNEKLQWLKLHDKHPEYSKMVDKIEAKKYVASIIGDEYIIPTLGIWNSVDEIDWNSLPNQFVIKVTSDSGGIVVCKDKAKLDIEKAKAKLKRGWGKNYYQFNKEYPYKDVKPRIIAEQYMEDESGYELKDYKIFCFDGEPKCLFVATGRQMHDTRFDFYDMDFNHLPFLNGHPNADKWPIKPDKFEEMVEVAKRLSKGICHVRVDLYNVNGKIYFGELTFFHWSGMTPFEPIEWDYKMGELLQLPFDNKNSRNKMKFALYTTAQIYGPKQTGGIKRYAELTEYAGVKMDNVVLYSRDDVDVIKGRGVKTFVKLIEAKGYKFFPPETRILLSNKNILKEIKKSDFEKIIIFDVPTATGPLLYGLKNVVLMIRKDMIGYERVQNKSKWKWLKIAFQWICESICMSKAKLIITQCNYDKNVLKDRHPLLAKKIEEKTVVQINNVNPSWIVTKSENAVDNSNLLGNTEKFRICFIGGFGNPRKGQDLFLDAAADIVNERSDIQFILIGDGSRLDVYKKKYESNNIIFLGRQDNPLGILKQCDLLVVPSLADSCPNTVMEALYNGVPVIGSNAGGIPEILKDESALFELNVCSLKERILAYKHDEKALLELKERQMQRKEELTFDWAAKILEVINKV